MDFLNKALPNHNLEAPTAFQLYKTYTYLQDNEQSAYYKNLILTKYPETDYAKIIENPNYYEEIEKKRKEAQTFIQIYMICMKMKNTIK